MRYSRTTLIGITVSLVVSSLSFAADPPVVAPMPQPSMQGNSQMTKPAPGFIPLQPAQTQIQLSNELKTLQGVERIEQRLTAIEAILKGLVGKVEILAESTRVAHEQQRMLSERIQAQTELHREYPPAQRWGLVYGGEAVVDKETGLIWQRQVGTTATMWSGAAGICALLGVPNTITPHRGWRLPTVQELGSLAPLTQQSPFANVKWDGTWYWSSTVNTASRPYHAADGDDYPAVFTVGFGPNGSSYVSSRATEPGLGSGQPVWCVR